MSGSGAIDTDSEDEMPAGWEERVTLDGKVYYANHNLKSTQWVHPTTGKKKKVAGELPYGWERLVDSSENVYYVDHINKKTTYTDPRLAFAVEDKGDDTSVKQRFDGCSTAQQVLLGRDLSKRYAIITGGNSGIGFETAHSLVTHGAHVVIACRNMKKANQTVTNVLQSNPMAKIEAMYCDLTSLSSIKQFADNYKLRQWPLHILILNAGVFGLPFTTTEDGLEAIFQTNHLGHFYLTNLLKDVLIHSAPARVVVVSSESHRFTDLNLELMTREVLSPSHASQYRAIMAYNQSKMCNILFANELNRKLWTKNVNCNAVHPGNMICTGLSRHWWLYRIFFTLVRPFAKSKQQGAAPTVFCATARELEGVGGAYYNNCFRCVPSEECLNPKTAKKLWELSEQLIEEAFKVNKTGFLHIKEEII